MGTKIKELIQIKKKTPSELLEDKLNELEMRKLYYKKKIEDIELQICNHTNKLNDLKEGKLKIKNKYYYDDLKIWRD